MTGAGEGTGDAGGDEGVDAADGVGGEGSGGGDAGGTDGADDGKHDTGWGEAGDGAELDCDELGTVLLIQLDAARTCNPDAASDTCSVATQVTDMCGCAVAIDGAYEGLTQLQLTYDSWVEAGCGPWGCGAPCPVGEASSCTPGMGDQPATCTWDAG